MRWCNIQTNECDLQAMLVKWGPGAYEYRWNNQSKLLTNLFHKSHDAQMSYPTMHHFVTEICTCVHISVTKWCIVGYLANILWDVWDGLDNMVAITAKTDSITHIITLLVKSLYLLENRVPVEDIHWYPIFKWVAVTWTDHKVLVYKSQ